MQVLGIGPQRWQMPEAVSLPGDFLRDCPRLTREVVWRRGFRTCAEAYRFLHPLEFRLPAPGTYSSLIAASDRIETALCQGEQICVWGDFDVDGQTSTALLVGALRRMGGDVRFYIPDRTTESHGLNPAGLQQIAADHCRLIVTCDCGTNDVEQVERAHELGIDVIITDHHLQTSPIPNAVAVFNSSHMDRADPIWGVTGVAMAYLVVRELYARRGTPSHAQQDLDLVALGTVADLAPTTLANRAFLARGLPVLWSHPRPGVAALLKMIGAPATPLDSTKISFKLAPILNASGRLADARLGVELLLETDCDAARARAERLYALNTERQRLAESLEHEIDAQLSGGSCDQPIVYAVGDGWHLGLIGPAASHYASLYKRPAVIVSRIPGQMFARGSVRSYGSYDVLAALAEHSGLLRNWGGHAGAAGFSLSVRDIDALGTALAGTVEERSQCDRGVELHVDSEVEWEDAESGNLSVETLHNQIVPLEPFCEGNPAPVLATLDVQLVARRPFGKTGAYADLVFQDRRGREYQVKWWRHDAEWPGRGRFDIAYTLAVETWQGRSRARLTLVAARPAADP